LRGPAGSLVIENTDELKERLRRHTWSFSSLKNFFTCPCRFILEDMEAVKPPSCFEDKDSTNLLIGEFLHRFFAELKEHRPAVLHWQELFDTRWESDEDLRMKLPDQAVRKAIVQSHLADIAAWEKETGRPILFSDEVTEAELELSAPFGGGRYRLKGRIDRLQRDGDQTLITDLKYKEKKTYAEKDRLVDRLEKTDVFDDRFQLLIYAYLALQNKRATTGLLDAAGVNYSLNFGIARGLDYYTGMVFEAFAQNLGAENQILGGGAYRLAHLFGGDDVASCGFAMGFDRVMVSLGNSTAKKETVVAIACLPEGRKRALLVGRAFRDAGIRTETDLMERGLGAQLAHAAKSADFAIVIGKRETETGEVTIKDLHTGEQKTTSLEAAIAEVRSHGTR
jgi:hypothetical protein